MDKNKTIVNLYNKLPDNGSKGDFLKAWAKRVKRKVNTLKNHWIPTGEFPEWLKESQKDWAIDYLIKETETKTEKL